MLSQKTQEKIRAAVAELDYSQDNLARILVTGKSNLVGVVFPHLHLSFYTELLNQLIEQGKEKDYSFIVYTSRDSRDEEKELISKLISYRVKGIILLSHMLSREDIEKFSVPVVSIERPGGNFKQINNDNFEGGKLAGEQLIRDGCDVFIHINNGYYEDWPSFKRIVGFEFSVKDRQKEICIEKNLTDPHSEKALQAIQCLLSRILSEYKEKKLGFFCSNDDIAHLLQRECIKNGVRIPQDVEIIGYDNSPISDYAIYPITSISQDISLMAQIAIESLDNYQCYESIVSARLVRKATTSQDID